MGSAETERLLCVKYIKGNDIEDRKIVTLV